MREGLRLAPGDRGRDSAAQAPVDSALGCVAGGPTGAKRWLWSQAVRSIGPLARRHLQDGECELGLFATLLAAVGPILFMEAWWRYLLGLVPGKAGLERGSDFVALGLAMQAVFGFFADCCFVVAGWRPASGRRGDRSLGPASVAQLDAGRISLSGNCCIDDQSVRGLMRSERVRQAPKEERSNEMDENRHRFNPRAHLIGSGGAGDCRLGSGRQPFHKQRGHPAKARRPLALAVRRRQSQAVGELGRRDSRRARATLLPAARRRG